MIDRTPWERATYLEKRRGLRRLARRGVIPGLAVLLCRDECRPGRPPHVTAEYPAPPDLRCPRCDEPAAMLELEPAVEEVRIDG